MKAKNAEPYTLLKQSPIFAMSHGGLELFHSNVWKWLIEHDPNYATVFFPELSERSVEVFREQNHRDLTIREKDRSDVLYVIENKTKTLPIACQLEQYSATISKEGKILARGVVVGIVDPSLDVKGWSWLALEQIAQRIMNIGKNEADTKVKSIVLEYAETTAVMCRFLKSGVERLAGGLPDPDRREQELEDLHLRDIYFKLAANLFVRQFRKSNKFIAMRNRFNKIGLDLLVVDDFSNKSWRIDIKVFKIGNGKAFNESEGDPFVTFGIQIQGGQFRRMAEVFHASQSNLFEKIFSRFHKLGWFDDGVGTAGWRKGCKTSQRKTSRKTNKYATYSPAFVYQYIDLDLFSYSSISGAICKQLDKALNLLGIVSVQTVFSCPHQNKGGVNSVVDAV